MLPGEQDEVCGGGKPEHSNRREGVLWAPLCFSPFLLKANCLRIAVFTVPIRNSSYMYTARPLVSACCSTVTVTSSIRPLMRSR